MSSFRSCCCICLPDEATEKAKRLFPFGLGGFDKFADDFFFVTQNGVDFVQQFLIGNPLPEFHVEEQKMYDFVVFSVFYGKDFFDEFHLLSICFHNVSGCCAVVSLFF